MSEVVAVIPARYGSTRFPGKPLALIKGKPLLSWVIEGTKTSSLLTRILVATDDHRIAEVADENGVQWVMTDSDLPSGSDRVWAAVQGGSEDLIINVQGDEPLVTGELIDNLIKPMQQDPGLQMGTLAHELSYEELLSENSVKVICNEKSEAIYFSRLPIPYSRIKPEKNRSFPAALKHIGMYAYRKSFLGQYCATSQALIEEAESLEQLRALYLGARIKVIKVDYRSWGVDTPEDVEKIEKIMGGAAR